MSKSLFGLSAVALVSLVGCGDPIVGHWDCDVDDECGDAEFDVKDDLTGDGDGTFNDGVSSFNCNYDIDVTNTGSDNYDLEVTFTGSCSAADKVKDTCRITSDGLLECNDFGTFRKRD